MIERFRKLDVNNPEGMEVNSPGCQSGVKGRSNQNLSPFGTAEKKCYC